MPRVRFRNANQVVPYNRHNRPGAVRLHNVIRATTGAVVRRVAQNAARQAAQAASERLRNAARRAANNATNNTRHRRQPHRIDGRSSGPVHTSTTIIRRYTRRKRRFLRKLFKNRPIKQTYVNRFGFSWCGQATQNRVTWYSVCHLKFNNVIKYMKGRIIYPSNKVGTISGTVLKTDEVGNSPDSFIYLGKCTFAYEIYNPTNYLMTVYIYDLVCKKDTPHEIDYNNADSDTNSAPEACMQKGSKSMQDVAGDNPSIVVGDPTKEQGTYWNSLGMKPTNYHLFNVLWKVKRVRKIVLPPQSAQHHIVVYNPRKKLTLGGLYYPREGWKEGRKNGLGGLTQATLFGFQGQVATKANEGETNTTDVAVLPGRLIVKCVKKVNVWNMDLSVNTVISENSLSTIANPKIYSDLVPQIPATA